MANRFKIESHPQRYQIERAIIEGKSPEKIASDFAGITERSIRRYQKDYMPQMLRHAQLDHAEGIIERIAEYTEGIDKLYKSIEKYLEDPKNPGMIDFAPNASEIFCTYKYTDEEGRELKGKDTIQNLLSRTDVSPLKLSLGITDPRITMLKSAEVLNKQLELLAKARGAIKEEKTVINNIVTGSLQDILTIAKKALEPYPEALEALSQALLK